MNKYDGTVSSLKLSTVNDLSYILNCNDKWMDLAELIGLKNSEIERINENENSAFLLIKELMRLAYPVTKLQAWLNENELERGANLLTSYTVQQISKPKFDIKKSDLDKIPNIYKRKEEKEELSNNLRSFLDM